MSTIPRFAHGVMTITLAGDEFDLAANVRASRMVCRLYGGLQDAFVKANAYDFETLVNIINAATGRVGKAAEATAEAVFSEGIVTVAPLVTTYLNFLAAGGKVAKPEPAKPVADATEADAGEPA